MNQQRGLLILAYLPLLVFGWQVWAQESLLSSLVKRIQPVVATIAATLQRVPGQNLNFAIPGERVLALKSEKGRTQAEGTEGVTKEGLATAEGSFFKGLNYFWMKDHAKALPYFKEAARRNPRYAAAWFYIGFCNDELGRWHDAVGAYQQAIRLKPDHALAHFNLGGAYEKLGRNQDAVAALQEAIRLQPEDAEAHINLGVAYGKLRRNQDAIVAYQLALRFRPDYALAYINLGGAYSNLGRNQDAVAAYQQAIRLKPDDARAHLGLGAVYLTLGDKGSALEEYQILKTLDQNSANNLLRFIYQ